MKSGSKTQINSFEEALACLDVNRAYLSQEEKRELDERGFLILMNLINESEPARLRSAFEQVNAEQQHSDDKRQSEIRHINDLVNKGDLFEQAYTHSKLLAAVYHILAGNAQSGSPLHFRHLILMPEIKVIFSIMALTSEKFLIRM